MKTVFFLTMTLASLAFADEAAQDVAQENPVVVKKVVPGAVETEEVAIETETLECADENQK